MSHQEFSLAAGQDKQPVTLAVFIAFIILHWPSRITGVQPAQRNLCKISREFRALGQFASNFNFTEVSKPVN